MSEGKGQGAPASGRRQFVKTALAAGGAAAAGAAGMAAVGPFVHTRKRFLWRMATTWPANFPVYGEAAKLLADWIEVMSEGRLQIKVFGNGELMPALQVFNAASKGVIEMGHGSSSYWAKQLPAAQMFAKVPFGMNPQQMIAWIYAGGGLRLWEELYRDFNLLPMPIGNSGMGMGGWFNRPIERMEDFQGLKMRITGLAAKAIVRAGGTTILTPENEIYGVLERGVVDAAEYGGPYHDYLMAFYKVARYYYYPSWHEPGLNLELCINLNAWNSLPRDLQAILRAATCQSYLYEFTTFEARNHEYLERLTREHQVELRAFPREVLTRLKQLSIEVMEEQAATDPVFRKIWDSHESFRRSIHAWHGVTEYPYAATFNY